MKKTTSFNILRIFYYIMGMLLFFAPFAYYQKTLSRWLPEKAGEDIHAFCLRIPLQYLFTGKGLSLLSVGTISVLLLLLSGFLLGAIFCGKFCAAGALPEYLSRLIPDKFKVDWSKVVNPVPVRYGFLAGFLITPFLAGSIACAFCNLSFMQRLVSAGISRDLGVFGSTAIITGFLWLGLFGMFTKGGRGYCNFICPIGAFLGFVQNLGSRFGFTFKLRYESRKCTHCQACINVCPMGSLLENSGTGLRYQVHNCISCRQCENTCPSGAITYGTGEAGWNRTSTVETEALVPAKETLP